MNIEVIGDKMVRVTLSSLDLTSYNIDYNNLNYSNAEARRVVFEIIQLVRELTPVDLSAKKIFIESFKSKDGGCIFYISSKPKITAQTKPLPKYPEGFNAPIIFEFKDFKDLCLACKNLFLLYNHIILKSNLFVNNEQYILSIYTYFKQDSKIISLTSEYGSFFGQGDLKNALICEHSDAILLDNAIPFIYEHIA
jgi:negative regulator of genetic competence, sporulation and motility